VSDDTLLPTLRVEPIPPRFAAQGFDCSEQDLTDYICDGTAAGEELAAVSRSYLILAKDADLVGYFTVLADSIRLSAKERPEGVPYSTAPARSLSEQVGLRYVTLDALGRPRLVQWYSAYGFVKNRGETDRQVAVLKFFKRWKSGDELNHVSMRFDTLLLDEASGGLALV